MKNEFNDKISYWLEKQKNNKYQLFLKTFDEVCLVDENKHWIGIKNQSQSLLEISSKSISSSDSSSSDPDLRWSNNPSSINFLMSSTKTELYVSQVSSSKPSHPYLGSYKDNSSSFIFCSKYLFRKSSKSKSK